MEQASELFMDLVCQGGTPSADCQFCGRMHFASGSGSCEPDESIENLRKAAADYPDKYCESTDDAIAIGLLDGCQFVWNCPCCKIRKYEDFIWNHRELIVSYIKARAEQQVAESQAILRNLTGAHP